MSPGLTKRRKRLSAGQKKTLHSSFYVGKRKKEKTDVADCPSMLKGIAVCSKFLTGKKEKTTKSLYVSSRIQASSGARITSKALPLD